MLLVCLKHLALYLFGIYKLCCDSMKSSEERPRPETSAHYPALVIFSAIIAGGLLYGLLSKTPEEAGLEATGQDWDIGLVDTVNMVLDDGSVYEGTVIAGSSTPHGHGILARDSVYYEGDWQYGALMWGRRSSEDAVYTGCFDDRLRSHGYGIVDYSRSYIESRQNRVAPGADVIRHYAGNWNHDVMDGLGRAFMADGSQRFGTFKNGVFQPVEGAAYNVGDRVYGIDLSHHNRDIDWANLALYCDAKGNVFHKSPGTRRYMQPVSFVYMKATEGANHVDTTYARRALEADRHGIAKGAYHFLRLGSPIDEQVRNFVQTVNWQPGDMPPALDVEIPAELRKYGTSGVFEWLEAVENELGVRPIIYTGDNIRAKYLAKDPRFSKYECWIARYNPKGPDSDNWQIWQMSDRGRGKGHSGNIDINLFGGSHQDFNNYRRDVALR